MIYIKHRNKCRDYGVHTRMAKIKTIYIKCWDSNTLLLEIQNDVTSSDNSLVASQKVEYASTM